MALGGVQARSRSPLGHAGRRRPGLHAPLEWRFHRLAVLLDDAADVAPTLAKVPADETDVGIHLHQHPQVPQLAGRQEEEEEFTKQQLAGR